MAGEQRVLELRQDGVLVAHDAGDERLAGARSAPTALRRISSLTGTDSQPDSRSWPRVAGRAVMASTVVSARWFGSSLGDRCAAARQRRRRERSSPRRAACGGGHRGADHRRSACARSTCCRRARPRSRAMRPPSAADANVVPVIPSPHDRRRRPRRGRRDDRGRGGRRRADVDRVGRRPSPRSSAVDRAGSTPDRRTWRATQGALRLFLDGDARGFVACPVSHLDARSRSGTRGLATPAGHGGRSTPRRRRRCARTARRRGGAAAAGRRPRGPGLGVDGRLVHGRDERAAPAPPRGSCSDPGRSSSTSNRHENGWTVAATLQGPLESS